MQEAARAKGVQLRILNASTGSEIEAAFATLVQQHTDALVIGDDVFFSNKREQLVGLTLRHSLPPTNRCREFAAPGGLISYGQSLPPAMRHLAISPGRILT